MQSTTAGKEWGWELLTVMAQGLKTQSIAAGVGCRWELLTITVTEYGTSCSHFSEPGSRSWGLEAVPSYKSHPFKKQKQKQKPTTSSSVNLPSDDSTTSQNTATSLGLIVQTHDMNLKEVGTWHKSHPNWKGRLLPNRTQASIMKK